MTVQLGAFNPHTFIIPAIDVLGGTTTRLTQGEEAKATTYGHPSAWARSFRHSGFTHLHLVNLDGAFQKAEAATQRAIAEVLKEKKGTHIQFGGGIRTLKDVDTLIASGINRIILGSLLATHPDLVAHICRTYPQRIWAAIDFKGTQLVTHGWTQNSGLNPLQAAQRAKQLGISGLVVTDVSRDGMMQGPNVADSLAIAQAAHLPTILSGGLRHLADAEEAHAMGFAGAIAGKAIYGGDLLQQVNQRPRIADPLARVKENL